MTNQMLLMYLWDCYFKKESNSFVMQILILFEVHNLFHKQK
jgi:hypothetical protein